MALKTYTPAKERIEAARVKMSAHLVALAPELLKVQAEYDEAVKAYIALAEDAGARDWSCKTCGTWVPCYWEYCSGSRCTKDRPDTNHCENNRTFHLADC